MAFQSRDSVLNLASLLEEHHDRHNPALDHLEDSENQQTIVGDTALVVAVVPLEESKDKEWESTTTRRKLFEYSDCSSDNLNDRMTLCSDEDDMYYSEYFEFDPAFRPSPPKRPRQSLLSCLLPWMQQQTDLLESDDEYYNQDKLHCQEEENGSLDSGKTSTTTDFNASDDDADDEKCNTDECLKVEEKEKKPRRGILKVSSAFPKELEPHSIGNGNNKERRTLFPRAYASSGSSTKRNVKFCQVAQVSIVESFKGNLTAAEKANVWWQTSDYQDFKKTIRLITKASEMLLDSRDRRLIIKVGGSSETMTTEEKWWCKFGHSRRGLEHIKCPAEGEERRRKVQSAVQTVLREQERQRRRQINNYTQEGPEETTTPASEKYDEQRIRQIYSRANRWARELGLAAAASDAAAVRSNFDNQKHCNRDYQIQQKRKALLREVDNLPFFMKRHLYPSLMPRGREI